MWLNRSKEPSLRVVERGAFAQNQEGPLYGALFYETDIALLPTVPAQVRIHEKRYNHTGRKDRDG